MNVAHRAMSSGGRVRHREAWKRRFGTSSEMGGRVALVVNHAVVEQLARELAEATGEPVPEALMKALEDRLRRVRGRWRRGRGSDRDGRAPRA